jgi:hypothetical protein
MSSPTQTRKTRARKTYADRTGMNSRASISLVKGLYEKVQTTEDDNGNVMRVWKSSEMSSYSNADIASCLRNRVAIEANEMLGTVPPSAVKYSVTKGCLIPNESKTLYRITIRAAIELGLPMHFKGKLNNRKIPFVAAPDKKVGK